MYFIGDLLWDFNTIKKYKMCSSLLTFPLCVISIFFMDILNQLDNFYMNWSTILILPLIVSLCIGAIYPIYLEKIIYFLYIKKRHKSLLKKIAKKSINKKDLYIQFCLYIFDLILCLMIYNFSSILLTPIIILTILQLLSNLVSFYIVYKTILK